MARHALAEPAADLSPAGVAGLLCGVHAQVLSAAELSIGRRIVGATRADVRRALGPERTLVKTFGPRGTVHLLPAADLAVWTGALSALPAPVPTHPEGVRFTPGQADEVIAALGAALADAELTVDELTEAIADLVGPWAVERTMDAFQISCHCRDARGWMKLEAAPPADVVLPWRCVPVFQTDAGARPVGTPDCCCERVSQDLDLVAGSAGGAPLSSIGGRQGGRRWRSSIRGSPGSTCTRRSSGWRSGCPVSGPASAS
jgi:hypothetical protein